MHGQNHIKFVKITLAGYLTDVVFVHEIRVFVLGLETDCHII